MTTKTTFTCAFCTEIFRNQSSFFDHLEQEHYSLDCQVFCDHFNEAIRNETDLTDFRIERPTLTQAFGGCFRTYNKSFTLEEGYGDLLCDPLRLLCLLK